MFCLGLAGTWSKAFPSFKHGIAGLCADVDQSSSDLCSKLVSVQTILSWCVCWSSCASDDLWGSALSDMVLVDPVLTLGSVLVS